MYVLGHKITTTFVNFKKKSIKRGIDGHLSTLALMLGNAGESRVWILSFILKF